MNRAIILVDHVLVFPYFLAPGRHSRQDIPRLCAEEAAKYPDVDWHCSGPIGLDPCSPN